MAMALLFAGVARRTKTSLLFRALSCILRYPPPLSSPMSMRGEGVAVEEGRTDAAAEDDLGSRMIRLRFHRRSTTDVLERWVSEGREVAASELRRIAMVLKRKQRYKHALEILTWMESVANIKLFSSDHAAKVELIIKVHSVDDAEAYFHRLSSSLSKKAASFPLLHFYVKKRDLHQAEAFMMMLQNSGLAVDPHLFNEMMKLYIATSQFKAVLMVIQYMKRCKISLNGLSYNLWMDACSKVSDVASVEMVLEEMISENVVGWSMYANLANIYVCYGLNEKAYDALRIAEEKLSMEKRLGHSFIMTIYAALNDRDGVLRFWESSKRAQGRITCKDYMSVMLCLVKLGEMAEAEKIFSAWELECRNYDIRVSNVLLGAYVRNEWMDKAEFLHFHTLKKGACPNYKTWEILMEGWVENKQMDKAVEAMKKGLSLLKGCHWNPPTIIIMSIAKYYEDLGNTEDMRRYVKVLQNFGLISLPLYKSFLRAHINAKKIIPDILSMMGSDQIDLDEETVALVQCANKTSNFDDDLFVSEE